MAGDVGRFVGEQEAHRGGDLIHASVPAAGDASAPGLRLAGDLLERAGVDSGEVLLITDAAVNIAPDLEGKRWICQNAITTT